MAIAPATKDAADDLARAIQGRDWSQTPLGPVEHWPATMHTVIDLVLGSPTPMLTLWGESAVMIYNDAYVAIAGARHPQLLGRGVIEGWPELAELHRDVLRTVAAGGRRRLRNQSLVLHRNGSAEEVWLNLDFSPIEEGGRVIGALCVVADTTAVQRTERRLARSEARLRAMLATLPVGVLIAEAPSALIVDGNRMAETILRQPLLPSWTGDVARRWQLFHPDGRPVAAEDDPLVRAVRTGERSEGEFVSPRGDGSDGFLRVIGSPIRDSAGRLVGGLATVIDIDRERRSHDALHEQQQRLAEILDGLGDIFYALDAGLRFTFYNAAAERFTGRSRAEILGRRLTDIAPGVAGTPIEAIFERVLRTRRAERFETDSVTRPGRLLDVRVFPIGDGIAAGISDITDQRAMEAALRVSENRFRVAVEALPQLVWTCRPDGLCNYLSRQWVEFTGVPEAEQFGLRWLEAVHPDDRVRTAAHWDGAVRGDHPYDVEYRIRRHDGSYRWFKTRGIPVRDGEGRIVQWFGTSTDIQNLVDEREREANQAEAELIHTQAQLRQAQKMEAIGQLTGGIAHDFNNLLASILASLQLAEHADGGEVQRYIDLATASVQRAASLTQRLLAFGRRQALEIQPVDLNALITSMAELIEHTLGAPGAAAIALRFELADDAGAVLADPNQLESALLNLVINARDAMPAGGELTIATRRLAGATARGGADDRVVLKVADTGCGIAPELLDKIFDPFFTTKPIGQGTGLGLSMVYGFMQQIGGRVEVDSVPGGGTRFRLLLPAAGPLVTAAGDPDRGVTAGPGGRTLLLVEDNDDLRTLGRRILSQLGYRVLDAEDGEQALACLQREPVDLLVTDVGLPGLSGRELAAIARERDPALRVLFVTGYADTAARDAGFLGPGMALLAKPFTIEQLVAKLAQLLAGAGARGDG